jgi:hypothetical protein
MFMYSRTYGGRKEPQTADHPEKQRDSGPRLDDSTSVRAASSTPLACAPPPALPSVLLR